MIKVYIVKILEMCFKVIMKYLLILSFDHASLTACNAPTDRWIIYWYDFQYSKKDVYVINHTGYTYAFIVLLYLVIYFQQLYGWKTNVSNLNMNTSSDLFHVAHAGGAECHRQHVCTNYRTGAGSKRGLIHTSSGNAPLSEVCLAMSI